MNDKYEWLDRLRAVDREAAVVAEAVARLQLGRAEGSMALPPGTSARDLASAARMLEATYLVRLWAEFEAAIRSYHRSLTGDRSPLRTRDLIETVGGARRGSAIPRPIRSAVHEVREYRNSLAHHRNIPGSPISLPEARRRLGRFLGSLPDRWS